MLRLSELKLPLPPIIRCEADATEDVWADGLPHPLTELRRLVMETLNVADSDVGELQVFKRSFDARKTDIKVVYIVDVALVSAALEQQVLHTYPDHSHIQPTPEMAYHLMAKAPVNLQKRPVVVGFGPCGIFAALILAQMGLQPIVLERGKKVRERIPDTWNLWRKRILNPESNVQFGEGGAGTFSDGKLYSQIKDPRHLGRKVMTELVNAGASPDILVNAHPHIGTFKLVNVVENLRSHIIALGGDIRFEQRVIDIDVQTDLHGRQLRGLTILNQTNGQTYELQADHVIMALGHSARDTFAMLHDRGVALQPKPFSVGFRIEHPQSVIDHARWGRHAGHPMLSAADYKLVHHASNGQTVYSFCMCPGGVVVAATSESGCVVTNGMSQHSRNSRNANAALVVGVDPCDYPQHASAFVQAFGESDGERYAGEVLAGLAAHPLSGINLQRQLESKAFVQGGSNYDAPGQLVGDFIADKASDTLGAVIPSYQPGVKLCNLSHSLHPKAIAALREALPAFGKKIKGFDMPDAVLTGVETRTSSPVRMVRSDDFQSTNTAGLYPGGEGAGYAGGILSSAVDGIKLAEAVALLMV
jgi:hypothetical protein